MTPLLELSARVGHDPLLTQASTGNASMKLDGALWIKASGKWVADAMHAVLPHRVVLHVHCVNTVAWAVRQDAPARTCWCSEITGW